MSSDQIGIFIVGGSLIAGLLFHGVQLLRLKVSEDD